MLRGLSQFGAVAVGEVGPRDSAQYNELGEKRFEEGIPLTQVLWAIITRKERLMECLGASGLGNSAIDLYQQQEFVRLIDHFFDLALCYTGEGYEQKAHAKTAVGSRNSTTAKELVTRGRRQERSLGLGGSTRPCKSNPRLY
jgi:hypothetical protein